MVMVVPMITESHSRSDGMRLRSRAAEQFPREAADRGERLLHFPGDQRRHANRTNQRDA
jgi:hypothetical protein